MGSTARDRLHGRRFDLLATVAIGAVVVGAALVPAVTANSGETITVRGDVELAGEPLDFFPVGFWTTDGAVIRSTSTDAKGDFTLDVPATLDGYVFAGTAPDADRAIVTVAGRQVVRGVIGRTVPDGVSTPLYQGWATATARSLAGAPDRLHFELAAPGRIAGRIPIARSGTRAAQVRRLDGSVVQTLSLDARGRYTSQQLAPGDYLVALVPVAPLLPTSVRVTVAAGRTVTASPPAPQTGGTIDGRVTVDGTAAPAGVPVLLLQDGRTVADTETSSGGAYRFTGLGGGELEVRVGVYPAESTAAVPASRVEVPSPVAAPTPTATPSPSASASTVPQPVERTTDAGLPGTTAVTVVAGVTSTVTTDLEPAGRVGGTVSGAGGVSTQVVAVDAVTGRPVRSTTAGANGRYSISGLVPGDQYRLWAVTRPADPTLARIGGTTGLATTSTTGVDVTVDRPAATLQGTVAGADRGTVTVGDAGVLQRTSSIDASGAYLVQGLVPETFAVADSVPGRLDSTPVAVTLTTPQADPEQNDGAATAPTEATQDLQPGPVAATFKGWFISGGAGVTHVSGTATSSTGDVVRFGPLTRGGNLTVRSLAPGTYTYDQDSFVDTVPALDGPWWFAAPTGSFVLQDGTVKDVGPVVLHVRAR